MKSKKGIDLSTFVKENYQLMSVMGVFGAISAIFATSKIDYEFISSIPFGIFLLVAIQLWLKFPKSEEASAIMRLFEAFFLMFIFSVFFIIYSESKTFFIMLIFFLSVAFFEVFSTILINRYRFYKIVRTVANKFKRFDRYIRGFFAIIHLILVVLLSIIVTRLVIWLFEFLRNNQ